MIPQDTEVIFAQDTEQIAQQLNLKVIVLDKDVPIITDPKKRKAPICALQLKKEDDLNDALHERHVKYIFGFETVLPKLTQVHAKQLKLREITLLFPFPCTSSKFLSYERKILPVLEKYGVHVLYVCLDKDPMHMRARHEKEAYYREVLKNECAKNE